MLAAASHLFKPLLVSGGGRPHPNVIITVLLLSLWGRAEMIKSRDDKTLIG